MYSIRQTLLWLLHLLLLLLLQLCTCVSHRLCHDMDIPAAVLIRSQSMGLVAAGCGVQHHHDSSQHAAVANHFQAFAVCMQRQRISPVSACLLTFLRLVVGPWLAEQDREDHQCGNDVLQRLRLAEVALKSNI